MEPEAGPRKGARSSLWLRAKHTGPRADKPGMDYVQSDRLDRASALRALSITLAAIALAFGTAWITVGRAGRFQELKGVFYTFDLPRSFERIDQEGAGGSLTSLGEAPSLERTFASEFDATKACTALGRTFRRGEETIFPDTIRSDTECSFVGREDGFDVRADLRTLTAFLDHVGKEELDFPAIPEGKRTILSVTVVTP
jgi:hypothetical protein